MKNNLNQKGFIVPMLIVIIALLVIGGGVYFYKNKKVEAPVVVNESENVGLDNQQEVVPIDTTVKNTNTKSFKLGTLEFSYPSILTLSKTGETTSLNHSIPYRHQFGCDFKGDTVTMLNDVNDFSASFKILNKDLLSSVKLSIGDNSLTQAIMGESSYKVGSLIGYKIQRGVEGCGTFEYYFPISANETLNISQGMHAQTLGQMGGPTTLDKIPEFITYTQEEQIFKDILSSVTGVNLQPETMTIKVYFGDTIDAQSCNTPSYVERIIPKTTAVARASIEELLKGPTEAEKLKDFWTGLRSGVSINSISINNGVASLDLSTPQASSLNDPNKGACGAVISIKQIENTLKQFPTIKNVLITINGGKQDSINP